MSVAHFHDNRNVQIVSKKSPLSLSDWLTTSVRSIRMMVLKLKEKKQWVAMGVLTDTAVQASV